MASTVVTASVVMAGDARPLYLLQGRHREPARLFLRMGLAFGLVSSVLAAFPTGDAQAKLVARHQTIAPAAIEGRFESGSDAAIPLIGKSPRRPEARG